MAGGPGFNGLNPTEWTLLSGSVFNSKAVSSTRNDFQKEHGATYPQALAERTIKMYAGEGDTVLDPFLGTGTTSIAACALGRKSVGFELYERFAKVPRCSAGSRPQRDHLFTGTSYLLIGPRL